MYAEEPMRNPKHRIYVQAVAALLVACGSNSTTTPKDSGQSGNANVSGAASSGTGGTPNSGGATASGGSGGGTGGNGASGAATGGNGGSIGIGGAAISGNGGNVSSGGSVSSGGAATSGASGSISTGGAGGSSGGTAAGAGGASNGCSLQTPATGTNIDGMLTVSGQARTYRLSVPVDYQAGEALPVVFVFNGVGGTGAQAQQFFQLEAGHRAIFVYPDALPNATTNGQIAWVFDQNGIDVAYFDALLALLEQNYCVDLGRVFALGASSGAIMSNMLGCFRGDTLRAIAPSSGMDWQQGGCKGDVAVMVICGAQDTFNPCDDAKNGGASETNVWAPQNGCTMQTSASPVSSICQAFQGCKPTEPVLFCTQPGGHGWPTSNGDFWWQFFMGLGPK